MERQKKWTSTNIVGVHFNLLVYLINSDMFETSVVTLTNY